MRRQRGVSLGGLLMGCVVLAILALIGMKVAPAYLQYGKIKKAVAAVAGSSDAREGTPTDIRKAFDRFASTDDITDLTGKELDITKERGAVVISFAYDKEIPLFSNMYLLIKFAGSSGQ